MKKLISSVAIAACTLGLAATTFAADSKGNDCVSVGAGMTKCQNSKNPTRNQRLLMRMQTNMMRVMEMKNTKSEVKMQRVEKQMIKKLSRHMINIKKDELDTKTRLQYNERIQKEIEKRAETEQKMKEKMMMFKSSSSTSSTSSAASSTSSAASSASSMSSSSAMSSSSSSMMSSSSSAQ